MRISGDDKNKGENEGADSQGSAFSFDPSVPLENERHERVCLEVLNGKSASRAYSLAYPDADYNSARSAGARLLTNVDVQSRLEYLREEQRSRLKMSADDIKLRLQMAANFDPADLYKPDGSMIPIHELPPEVRLCIEKIEVDEITVGQGEEKKTIGRTAKIHAISKKSALELLGKAEKMFVDKVEHTVKVSLEDLLAMSENPSDEGGE